MIFVKILFEHFESYLMINHSNPSFHSTKTRSESLLCLPFRDRKRANRFFSNPTTLVSRMTRFFQDRLNVGTGNLLVQKIESHSYTSGDSREQNKWIFFRLMGWNLSIKIQWGRLVSLAYFRGVESLPGEFRVVRGLKKGIVFFFFHDIPTRFIIRIHKAAEKKTRAKPK